MSAGAALLLCLGHVGFAEDKGMAAAPIPFDALTVSNRFLVRAVTDQFTLRRAYAARQFKARQDVFEYLLDHMEVTSALAQSLGMIRYRARRDESGRVHADDREGAAGYFLCVHADDGKRVFYVEGAHRGLFSVRGRGVAILAYRQADAETIEYTGAVIVKVDHVVWAALAKLFAIFLQGTVDGHFRHLIRHPIRLSEMAMAEPDKLLEHIGRLPEADRQLAATFAAMVNSNAAARTGQGPG